MSNALYCDYCGKSFSAGKRRYMVEEIMKLETYGKKDMCNICHNKIYRVSY